MSVFSGTTAIYIGNNSYSAAYVGDVQVWPMSSETYTLYTCIYGDNQGDEGRNYIILPFNTSGDLKVRFQGEVLYTAGGLILGGVYSADTYDYRFLYTSGRVYLDMGSQRVYKTFAMTGLTDFTISNFKIHNNVTGLDILTGATVTDVPDTEPFRVNMSKLKLTAISAWTGDTLIFAGAPAQRNRDGALGILDTLTNNFYTPLYPEYMYGCEPTPPVPPITGYRLTAKTYSTISSGDKVVFVEPNSKRIITGNNGKTSVVFSDFNGDGVYSGLPSGTEIFTIYKGTPAYNGYLRFSDDMCANVEFSSPSTHPDVQFYRGCSSQYNMHTAYINGENIQTDDNYSNTYLLVNKSGAPWFSTAYQVMGYKPFKVYKVEVIQ